MKLLTEQEMKEQLTMQNGMDNDNCYVDIETGFKIIMDAVLPLCK
jgi:hypothetical protein